MDILIIQRIFPKYRKDILDELHHHLNFVLVHSGNKSGISQVSSSYSEKVGGFQYSKKDTHIILNVFPYIIRERPKVIIHEFSMGILSLFPTYIVAKLLCIKFILWGHGYDRTQGFYPEKSFIDKLRMFLVKKADAIIFYGQEAKSEFSEYVTEEKLFIASNCLNTNVLNSIRDKLEAEGKENVKKRIGYIHKFNLIFIGRLLQSKKPELLIEVYKYLAKMHGDTVCIHFVGDGDCLDQIKNTVIEKGLNSNFKFYGAVNDDTKNGELLYCSDLMVMPGLVGLSINHAFNFDCPVVTFQQTGHGPEVEYLINGETGFLVEDYATESMALIISKYLNNIDVQDRMKARIRKMVETTCSINNFISGFDNAIKYVLKKENLQNGRE
jgi:glycosyltransferase involved in cell wall biosynthesis